MSRIPCPLFQAAKRFGFAPAVISKNKTISFLELNAAVDAALRHLKQKRLKRNSRVAIVSPACPEYIIALLALWRLGAIACPVSPRYPKKLVKETLHSICCSVVFTQHDLMRLAGAGRAGEAPVEKFLNTGQPATVLFTSGTTATPKAVLHSYGNHYFNAKGSNENLPLQQGDRWLLSLPLYHVSGMGIVFRCLLAGAAIVIPPADENLTKAIETYRITHLSCVCVQLKKLLDANRAIKRLRNLKAILLGGSFFPNALIQRAIELKLPIYKSYGLTETASQVTTTKKDDHPDRLFTAGKVLKYRKLRVAKDGEILVKDKVLFKGYLGRGGNLTSAPDGWFQTGDIGYLRKDGYLVVTGRKDNMFTSGGENIYPEEIEKVLLSDWRVSNAAVIAITDSLFGFRPAAFVLFRKNQSASAFELRNILQRQLPRFKIPDRFYAWPKQLPAAGIKTDRRQFVRFLNGKLLPLK